MAYRDYKDLPRKTASDKVVKKYLILLNINADLLQWYINFLMKSAAARTNKSGIGSETMSS